jgi:hypothetical protein
MGWPWRKLGGFLLRRRPTRAQLGGFRLLGPLERPAAFYSSASQETRLARSAIRLHDRSSFVGDALERELVAAARAPQAGV